MKKKLFLVFFCIVAAAVSAHDITFLSLDDNSKFCFTNNEFSIRKDDISEYQKLARDVFKELIEINTTSMYGSTKAAEAMAARLKSAGFPDSDIQVIGPDQQHKNLVWYN